MIKEISAFSLRGTDLDSLRGNPDPDTEYVLNSAGLRGPELDGSADIVALGCSQTFGQGVPEQDTWPNKLAKATNMSYVNLAVPSESSYGMLTQALAYIEQYGKPKVFAALFPGYGRMSIPINYRYNREREDIPARNFDESEIVNLNIDNRADRIPLLAKKPYPLENILSIEVPMHQSLQAVRHLITYCKIMDIKLVFSSWHPSMVEVMENLQFDGYQKIDSYNECHELDDQSNSSRWSKGSDLAEHMGIHSHIHYAEAFARILKSEN